MDNESIDIINKSICANKMSMIYIRGMSVSILGSVTENDIQRRKGWIERRLRSVNNYSIKFIIDSISMSRFWLNYVSMGIKYPNIISEHTYIEWDNDKD